AKLLPEGARSEDATGIALCGIITRTLPDQTRRSFPLNLIAQPQRFVVKAAENEPPEDAHRRIENNHLPMLGQYAVELAQRRARVFQVMPHVKQNHMTDGAGSESEIVGILNPV